MTPVQNHIHLSDTLGGSPENAPDVKWKVQYPGRREQTQVFLSVGYGLTGSLLENVLLDDSGDPITRKNFQYRLLVREHDGYDTEQRLALLDSWVGRRVYLVDSRHVADGADHTANVRTMFFAGLGDYPTDHTTLDFFYVDIQLLEAT